MVGRFGGAQVLKRDWMREAFLLSTALCGSVLCGIIVAIFSGQVLVAYAASDKRQRSNCGLRKWVSMRRAFLTSVICCYPASKRIEYRDSVVAWYSTFEVGAAASPGRRVAGSRP